MKRLLLSLAITSFVFFNSGSQNLGEFQFGIGGGLNLSNISIDDDDDLKTSTLSSYNVAFSTEYYFDDRLGVKAKFIYDNKGWEQEFTDFNNEVFDTVNNLTYITVPVMLNYHFGSLPSRKSSFVYRPWYMSIGPYVGFLSKAEAVGDKSTTDFKDTLKGTDYGAAFNFGVRFEVADFTKLFIEYDAQYGFSDISAGTTTSDLSDDITTRNGLRHSFNLGLLFAFY